MDHEFLVDGLESILNYLHSCEVLCRNRIEQERRLAPVSSSLEKLRTSVRQILDEVQPAAS